MPFEMPAGQKKDYLHRADSPGKAIRAKLLVEH
jgi:hypothetical protein